MGGVIVVLCARVCGWALFGCSISDLIVLVV